MTDRAGATTSPSRSYERALFVRQFVVTCLPAACYLLRFRSESARALLALTIAATVLNFTYYVLLTRGWFPAACRWARLALDISLWTLFLMYTGGPASFFYLGYLAEILLAAAAVSAAGCLLAAVLSSIGFGMSLLLFPAALSWEEGATRLLGLFLVGTICWAVVRRYEVGGRRIEDLNRDLAARADAIRGEVGELKERLARAQDLGRAGEAAAAMMHELRNTVHGLSGFLSLLKEDLGRDARIIRRVSLIESGIRDMHRMSDEVLGLFSGAARARRPLDVVDLLHEAIAFATQGRDRAGVTISLRSEGALDRVLANREALRGAFVNLIKNALEAMDSHGSGRLEIRPEMDGPGWIRIEFADTGPGVPPDIRDRIFDPLVTGRGDGLGMGLAISRRVVEAGGGTLTLAPDTGRGTRMVVRLPAYLPSGAATPAAPPWQEPVTDPAPRR